MKEYDLLKICESLRDSEIYQPNLILEALYMQIASLDTQDKLEDVSDVIWEMFEQVIIEEIFFQLFSTKRVVIES